MRKIFYPKIIFPFTKLFLIVFFAVILTFSTKSLYSQLSSNFDFGILIGASFYIIFICFVIFYLAYFLSFYYKFVLINDNLLSVFELNKLKISKVSFEEILGFSKSEVYFGKYSWKTKSIVIYYKNGTESEILNNFVFNLDLLESELKKKKVKYLGFEHYQTGWFFRTYKFNKK